MCTFYSDETFFYSPKLTVIEVELQVDKSLISDS